jgi:hypothetical protein
VHFMEYSLAFVAISVVNTAHSAPHRNYALREFRIQNCFVLLIVLFFFDDSSVRELVA